MKKRIKIGLALLTSLIMLFYMYKYLNNRNDNKEVIQSTQTIIESDIYENSIPDLRNIYNNQDIIAELKIPSISLDSVITKTTDNKFYLNHDAYKNNSILGNPYIDFRNEDNLDNEKQINIYSHNSSNSDYQDKLPFYKLENYLDKSVFENSSDIYLLTEEKQIKYQIVAVKVITSNNEHMILDTSNSDKWVKHIDNLLKDTVYCNDNCKLSKDDKLLILQTCHYNPVGSYLLVIAKKI